MKAEPDRWMLVRRVDRTAVNAAEQTIAIAGPAAGAHLEAAWTEAYGREPNPATAYEQAVKAVEAAAAPLFAPDDAKATLEKMISTIGSKPDKWTVVLDSDDPVGQLVAMMQLLWQAHSRHGKSDTVADATEEQARAAVHVATTLVQLLSSGAVEPAPLTAGTEQTVLGASWSRRTPHSVDSLTSGQGGDAMIRPCARHHLPTCRRR